MARALPLIDGMSTIHRARRYSCAVALFVALTASLPAAASPERGSAGGPDISAIRIDNFARVDSSLYRGAQPEGRGFADLQAIGVKTIVNLTSDDAIANEQALTEAAGMSYVQIPMTTRTNPTAAQLAQFLGIVNDPARQPVYVHCVGGRHRTGVMTAVYRITHDGWTGDRAFKEMKQFKYGADFLHPEFRDFVYAYRAEPRTAAAAAGAAASVQR
jgi:tyrosine-protein phosphatase SIW14